MSLLENLPHTIDISRLTYTIDASGGDVPTKASTPYADNEPAWVQPASAASIKEFAVRNQRVTHDVYMTRNPGLRLDDIIDVLDGPYASHCLSVLAWRECTAGLGLAWMAQCET